ncbi:MAG: AAA family ATPase, partial [Anaerolineae bacterium]|nr:AAA family ATPase [Anaerolineae bacterium]
MTDSPYLCASCNKPLAFGFAFCPNCGHAQHNGTGPLWLGERRRVTVLFADLASFTATSEKADSEDVIDMLNQVFTRLMVHCDQEGGYLDKIVGDQLMVLFGAPFAHEDDPLRAVRAALAMQQTMSDLAPYMKEKVGIACKINIGINAGTVVWGRVGPTGRAAPTVIGDAVNLACRLQQFAKDGQVMVSETVFHQTRRFVEYDVLDPIQVKGKSNLVPVYMPLKMRQSAQIQRHSLETKTPLIEREHELQSLHAHWARAVAGFPQMVLLTGEAGLGKSRLLSDFLGGLDAYANDKRPLIIKSHNDSAPGDRYSALASLLKQLFGLAPDDTDLLRRRKVEDRAHILGNTNRNFLPLMGYLLGWYSDDARLAEVKPDLDYLRESAIDEAASLFFKQSGQRPTILILDDLQWSDDSTAQFLIRLTAIKQMLQQNEKGYCLMVVAASRPQMQLQVESIRPDAHLSLAPLTLLACHELISALLPGRDVPGSLVEKLSQDSSGNPFYLEESIRGLVQSGQLVRRDGSWQLTRSIDQLDVPPSIEGLVMANLDALGPASRSVLEHASVIGLHFGYELLSAICSIENLPELLADLEQRGLIKLINDDETERVYAFTQMTTREVVYQTILRKTRRELHERIAQHTETHAGIITNDVETLA